MTERMTEEEFVHRILHDKITLEDYENRMIFADLRRYYKLKIGAELVSRVCRKKVEKTRFSLNRARHRNFAAISRKIENMRKLIYDDGWEFEFSRKVPKEDFGLLLEFMDNAPIAKDAVLRLNWYKYFRGMSREEVLALYPEDERFLDHLKGTGNQEAVDIWLELHPEHQTSN